MIYARYLSVGNCPNLIRGPLTLVKILIYGAGTFVFHHHRACSMVCLCVDVLVALFEHSSKEEPISPHQDVTNTIQPPP